MLLRLRHTPLARSLVNRACTGVALVSIEHTAYLVFCNQLSPERVRKRSRWAKQPSELVAAYPDVDGHLEGRAYALDTRACAINICWCSRWRAATLAGKMPEPRHLGHLFAEDDGPSYIVGRHRRGA